MCGRYELQARKQELWERYHLLEEETVKISPQEEIFPTNICPVIVPGPHLKELKWGLTESFSKKPLINARAETILQKPTFRNAFIHSRCLIPATAFFEWEKQGEHKQKHRITIKEIPIFSLAGIRKEYHQEDGSTLETFSIITTTANQEFKSIHDRMPVILKPEDEKVYLDLQKSPSEISTLLMPVQMTLIIE